MLLIPFAGPKLQGVSQGKDVGQGEDSPWGINTERRNSPIENASWIKAPREALPGRLEGEGDCYGESPFYGSD